MSIPNVSDNLVQSKNDSSDSDNTINSETEELSTLAPCKKFRYYNKHFKILQKSGKFYCCFCPKEFGTENLQKSWSDFIEHTKCHPATKRVKYKILCDICGKKIDRTYQARHMRQHGNYPPYKCLNCSKTFRYENSFAAHKRIHTGDLFTCRFCNKGYTYIRQVRDHERIHTGESPYKCNQCDKSFRSMSLLHNHRKRTHARVKPYPCKYCKQSFTEQRHCDQHMKFHAEIKEFKCKVCNEIFNHPRSYAKHLRVHTGEEPYPCNQCKKIFLTRKRLHKHYNTKHTIVNPEPCKVLQIPIEVALKDHLYFQVHQNLTDSQEVLNKSISSFSDNSTNSRKCKPNQTQKCQVEISGNTSASEIQKVQNTSHTKNLVNDKENNITHRRISIEKLTSYVQDDCANEITYSKKFVIGESSYIKEFKNIYPTEGQTSNETDENYSTNDCMILTDDDENNHLQSESHLSFGKENAVYIEHEILVQDEANFPDSSSNLTQHHVSHRVGHKICTEIVVKCSTNPSKEHANHTTEDPTIIDDLNCRNPLEFYKNKTDKDQKGSTLKEHGVSTRDLIGDIENENGYKRSDASTIDNYKNHPDTNCIEHDLCETEVHENFTDNVLSPMADQTKLENYSNGSKKQEISLEHYIESTDNHPNTEMNDQSYTEYAVNAEGHIHHTEHILSGFEDQVNCIDKTKRLKKDLSNLEHEGYVDYHKIHKQDEANLPTGNAKCKEKIFSDKEKNILTIDHASYIENHKSNLHCLKDNTNLTEIYANASNPSLKTNSNHENFAIGKNVFESDFSNVKDHKIYTKYCKNHPTDERNFSEDSGKHLKNNENYKTASEGDTDQASHLSHTEEYESAAATNTTMLEVQIIDHIACTDNRVNTADQLSHTEDTHTDQDCNLMHTKDHLNFAENHSNNKDKLTKEGTNSKQSMETKENKIYSCAHCSKTFIIAKSLLVHLKTHMGSSICSCEYCSTRCSQREHYRLKGNFKRKGIKLKNRNNKFAVRGPHNSFNQSIHYAQASSSGLVSSTYNRTVNSLRKLESKKIDVNKCLRKKYIKLLNSKNCKNNVQVPGGNNKDKSVLIQNSPSKCKRKRVVQTSDSELGQQSTVKTSKKNNETTLNLGSPEERDETQEITISHSELQKKNAKKPNEKKEDTVISKQKRQKNYKQDDLVHKTELPAKPSKGKVYECKDCNKTLKSKRRWNSHLERMHNRMFFCRYCFKHILGIIDFKKHCQIHRAEKRFTCQYCNKPFRDMSTLIMHLRIHSKEKPFSCRYCERAFAQKANLVKHLNLHTGENKYTCDYCEKTFLYRRGLIEHIRFHTGEKPFVCPHCNKAFVREWGYKNHLKLHTEATLQSHKDKRFICQYCNKSFKDRCALKIHLRIHLNEKPYSCEYCGKAFTQKGTYTNHLQLHTGEKKYSCSFCEKKFIRKHSLIVHIRYHTGEKPFVCPQCNKAFARESSYKSHLKSHAVERPFACHICKRLYATKEGRDSHLHFHESNKRSEPVFCPLCSKQFSIPSKLKRHMKVHAGKDLYSCNCCDEKFFNLQDLKNHEAVHLKNDPYVITVHRLHPENVPEGVELIQPHEMHESFSDAALKVFIQQSQVPITDIFIQSS